MGRSRSWSRSRSRSPEKGHRVHIADLCSSASKRDLEKACEKYGPLKEVWVAKGPPSFAFVVFEFREDAEDCVREMNGKMIRDKSIRVTHALPRTRGRGRRRFDPDMRCYNCGQRGHFSRDCNGSWSGSRRRSPSPRFRFRRRNSRSRSGSRDRYTRRRSRTRSRSHSYRRSPSRSASRSPPPLRSSRASPPPERVSRSRSRS